MGSQSAGDFRPERFDQLDARAHEGPAAPHEGGAPAAAAGDWTAGRRGPGRRALRREVRLGMLPPR